MPTPSLAALPIRRLTHRDLIACADLSEDRGWLREEHKWGLLLTAGKGYGIDDPDGGLVSACVVTEYGPHDRPSLGAIGMVLVTGMVVGTLFTLFVVPVFYSLIAADRTKAAESEFAFHVDGEHHPRRPEVPTPRTRPTGALQPS